MKGRYLSWLVLFLMITSLLLSSCTSASTPTPTATKAASGTKPLKVALILPGRIDDLSWNQAAYEGLRKLKNQMGAAMEMSYVENVYNVTDIEPALRDYAQRGYDLVIGHGFQFQEPIIKVAAEFPKVHFALGTGYKLAPNVGVYDVKLEEGGYLAGVLAASLTKSNKIGVIGGVDVSEIHRGQEAYKYAAKQTKPNIDIMEVYTGDFRDTAKAKEAALRMIDSGADVLWTTGDGVGLGVVQGAKERNTKVIGVVMDQRPLAPDQAVTSVAYDWSISFAEMIDDIKAGTFGNKHYWLTLKNKGLVLSPFNEKLVGKDVISKVEQAREDIISGKIKIPEFKQ
ncbi:MAG: BMP family protein [Chloroflexi bacterium]|nr:BMP family protein [Chloroflexota bacterium]MCL5076472.1 BMP family protein [Chloroflexota bacterium]